MTAAALLKVLQDCGIRLWVDGDRLRYRGPKRVLTAELRDAIASQKAALVDLLMKTDSVGCPSSNSVAAQPEGGEMPLSFGQQRMWFLNQSDTRGDVQHNLAWAIALSGPLHADVLVRALRAVERRHGSLRTRFVNREGVPYQLVDDDAGIDIPVVDTTRHDLSARIDAHARHVFDLESGAPWKADVLRLSDNEHVLLINIHHTVCDALSFKVLFGDLSALYGAFLRGALDPSPALPIRYIDYACVQRLSIDQGRLEADLEYWKARLRGAPRLLALPSDRPRPARMSYRGASLSFHLPKALRDRLDKRSRAEGATLFMGLLAAFKLLLWRYTRQTDIVVGTPVAARHQPALERLIGFFVNTLVLRTRLDPRDSFFALLRKVRSTVLEAQDHQGIPFDYLVDRLNPARSLSHAPIVQILFVFHQTALSSLNLPGVEARRLEQDRGAAQNDVIVALYERADGIVGIVEYSTDLFDQSTIEHLFDHYQRLLEAIVADPDRRIGDYDFLSDAEKQTLLAECNATETAYPDVQTIHGFFEAQAAKIPDAIALVFEHQHLSYRVLNARSNRLAHYLRVQGVGPETRVGLCIERSPEQVIGILGILKAGGAYVPLDPAYPAERLAFTMQNANVRVLVRSTAVELPAFSGTVIQFDRDWEAVLAGEKSGVDSAAKVSADQLVYVIYTSGSTGTPKGVSLTHRALVNLIRWQNESGSYKPCTTLQFAALGFDVCTQEVFVTLSAGGTLVFIKEEVRRDPTTLAAALKRYRVERAFLPVAAFKALMQTVAYEKIALPGLRELILAGEQLQITPVVLEGLEQLPACRLYNHYGPTETHVVTAYELVGDAKSWPVLPPIGRPLPNCEIYIVNPDCPWEIAPINVPGELLIGGVHLARGYLNRPAQTAEKFIPNPFGAMGGRLYRTGDLARYRPDGNIEYLGRNDHQVKIRGFRVEPGEIETELSRHPQVREAVVVAREGPSGDKRLVAYLTHRGEAPTVEELRAQLKVNLPEYMLPSAFVVLEALPLNPNGKLDRAALPDPKVRAGRADNHIAPRTPVEHAVAAIWRELLNLERVGIHDDFFAIGGNSLVAMQVVHRLKRVLRVRLPVKVMFERPTIEEIAFQIDVIDQARPEPSASAGSRDVERIEI